MDLMRKWIQEGMEEAKEVKHLAQISSRSSLYSIFRRIEELYNRGEKAEIDTIKALLDAFEAGEETGKVNTVLGDVVDKVD
jgi:predicted transcriptional regulator